jgi:hypothetical protein
VLAAGEWDFGAIDLIDDSGAAALMKIALESSLLDPAADALTVLKGPWCQAPDLEEALSSALADLLIPPPLFRRLLEDADNPTSLVVAGNLFAHIPLPLLALDVDLGHGRRTRLVEIATLRFAPPAAVVATVPRLEEPSDTTIRPVSVACVNPTDDPRINNSATVPPGSHIVLSGRPAEGQIHATRENLLNAIRATSPRDPSVFYFSGHAVQEGAGGDVEDGLMLADGPVSAADIFAMRHQGSSLAPFPERALIAACQSSGAGGSGSGEWFGLTGAMLVAGARQVVATNWPIWDTPFTAQFDMEMTKLLQRAHDPAMALQQLQVACLRDWLASDVDTSHWSRPGIPSAYRSTPFPMIWSAYCCAGVIA